MLMSTPIAEPLDCGGCALRSREMCRAITGVASGSGAGRAPRRRSAAAETRLQEEDERSRFAGILRKGFLRTERILQDGRRSVLTFLTPGDVIGDPLGTDRNPALVCATDAELCLFDPGTLRRAMAREPTVTARLIAEALKQHTRQLEMVWRRGALTSRERIIAFMVMATEFMPVDPLPDGGLILTMKISRKDWADFSNSTVETISRTLGYLTEKNMVSTVSPGRYRIRDLGVLALLAGLDSRCDRSAMNLDDPAPS